jgi:hypothetical protein
MDRVHADRVVLMPYVAAIEEAVRRRKKRGASRKPVCD